MKVDLHLHTNASDGTWYPEELLEQIKQNDIKIFSVTDHDTMVNSLKMKELVTDDLYFIFGTEISSTYQGREYHILAYDFDENNEDIKNLLHHNDTLRNDFDLMMIRAIKKLLGKGDASDFEEYTYDPARGGWNALNYLIDNNYITHMREYNQFIRQSGNSITFYEPKDIIKIIHDAGGYAFLAHPSAYTEGDFLEESRLLTFKNFGIDGLECYTPYLSDVKHAEYYKDFCKKNDLMMSAGSDCHGTFVNRPIGTAATLSDLKLDFIKTKDN